jgi:hypothetical protein
MLFMRCHKELVRSTSLIGLISFMAFVLLSCTEQNKKALGTLVYRTDAPYPPSPVIEGVIWDFNKIARFAFGSDIWPITWADDDALYTVWGDGSGFGVEPVGRVTLGVARIVGSPESLKATNVFGGNDPVSPATFDGKSHAIISIDGVLYMWVEEQGKWKRGKVGRSTDHGKTWRFKGGTGTFQDSDWTFEEPGGVFASPALLQYGRDYRDARDRYVYGYSERVRGVPQKDLVMFRVPKDQLMDRSRYEFFGGMNQSGVPTWTNLINEMKPVYTDPNGVAWGVQVMHHPVLKRYLMTVRPDDLGSSWGIFDAPEPWGPWTTVAYYSEWLDSTRKITYVFNPKWISPDGKTMFMVFSGTDHDAFNLVKATLKLRTPSEKVQPNSFDPHKDGMK